MCFSSGASNSPLLDSGIKEHVCEAQEPKKHQHAEPNDRGDDECCDAVMLIAGEFDCSNKHIGGREMWSYPIWYALQILSPCESCLVFMRLEVRIIGWFFSN